MLQIKLTVAILHSNGIWFGFQYFFVFIGNKGLFKVPEFIFRWF